MRESENESEKKREGVERERPMDNASERAPARARAREREREKREQHREQEKKERQEKRERANAREAARAKEKAETEGISRNINGNAIHVALDHLDHVSMCGAREIVRHRVHACVDDGTRRDKRGGGVEGGEGGGEGHCCKERDNTRFMHTELGAHPACIQHSTAILTSTPTNLPSV